MAVACGLGRRSQFGVEYIEDQRVHEVVPSYTSSLDAVVALIEEKLPGWAFEVTRWGASARAMLTECDEKGWHTSSMKLVASRETSTAPLALLAALLQALIEVQK